MQFLKESAVLAGFPDPLIAGPGCCAAVQYSATLDSSKDKSIIMIDFGQINTSIAGIKFGTSNRQSNINVTGSAWTSVFSGMHMDRIAEDMIVKNAAKLEIISSEQRASIHRSAVLLKEKLTSNENFIMAVPLFS